MNGKVRGARTPTIDWRPGALQLLPAACIAGPWVAAVAFTTLRQYAEWITPALFVVAGFALRGFRNRASVVRLRGADTDLLIDDVPWTLRFAWLAPRIVVVGARAPDGRDRRFWIHASEVDAPDFARLRRFVLRVLPQVTPRPASTRRAGR